ncbi:extracellular solute-binding protein [Stakelama saccharophila]|uniref:Extracellular solute-binding protein n=1 Tax=Stakelama saccharophila TaxID=3075605 RepID=A0ABZ0BB66_9SPHN|nr:extracellular solute-binding protein [Stakelama sp. W311]WNO54098.1 extracellular solute-binding protein [Stakelama sp. W311]
MTRPRLKIAVRRFEPFERAIAKQFDHFCRTTGCEAELEAQAMDLNALHDAIIGSGGLGDGSWDIAFMATDWLAEAQAAGLLEDLTPHMARAAVPDFPHGWSPSLTGLQGFAGGYWGLPYHDGPECLVYRTDLLAEAGIAVPADWDAFHEAARRLHAPEQGRYGTVLALYPDGHNGFYDFCIHIWSRGGEVFDRNGRPDFTSAQARAALDFIRGLAADTGAMVPDPRALDSVQSGLLFAEGKVAMMANWFGFAAYGDTAPDSKVKGKVDVAPLPAGPGGRSVSLNVFWVLAMGSGAADKPLAWDFMRHCARADMDLITTREGAIGTRKSTWADKGVNAEIPYYHRLDWLHEHARELPLTPKLAAISHIVDDLLTKATTGEASTADLLAEAQVRAEAL